MIPVSIAVIRPYFEFLFLNGWAVAGKRMKAEFAMNVPLKRG